MFIFKRDSKVVSKKNASFLEMTDANQTSLALIERFV